MNEYTGSGEPTYFEAAVKLSKTGKVHGITNDIDSYVFDEENPPTKKQIEDKYAELKTAWDAQEYARNRASEYPSNGDQWDMIYKDNKNSTTTHEDAVEAVKTKWPKDNSGPV